MVVFDLEWNSGLYETVSLDEILQIGAARIEAPGGPILDTFNVYVKPVVHKRLSPAARELPELENSMNSPFGFREAAEAFFAWCDGDQEFSSWGQSDMAALRSNIRYHKLKLRLPEVFYDMQAAFDATVGAVGQVALSSAIEYCGIPEIYSYHSARDDAVYTALITGFIAPEQLAKSLCAPDKEDRRGRRRFPPGLPRGLYVGPFSTREELLNNRGSRLAICPVCERRTCVSQWFWSREGTYCSRFGCPDHGGFMLRMNTAVDDKGRLWGSSAVLTLSKANRAALNAARCANHVFCQPLKVRSKTGCRR